MKVNIEKRLFIEEENRTNENGNIVFNLMREKIYHINSIPNLKMLTLKSFINNHIKINMLYINIVVLYIFGAINIWMPPYPRAVLVSMEHEAPKPVLICSFLHYYILAMLFLQFYTVSFFLVQWIK